MTKMEKFADIAIRIGINIQKGQYLIINSNVECSEFARVLAKAAYKNGAGNVIVRYHDDFLSKIQYEYTDIKELTEIPEYRIDEYKYFIEKKAARISIYSPTPDVFEGLDANKIMEADIAQQSKLGFYRDFSMANNVQWLVISAPNMTWAKKVFPSMNATDAYNALWDAIYKTTRVEDDNDPYEEWMNHFEEVKRNSKMLNDYNFKYLHFKNSLGTDLMVELKKDHIWSGGLEKSVDGIDFEPNMPSEEIFTMPEKYGVNGVVVATKPLEYQGRLIDRFKLEFKDGKVVSYSAKESEDALKSLIEFDEGSCYLGEVALVEHDSPISNSNILFYNTLFDENASCHLALGQAYPMNVKNGTSMSKEELKAINYNDSMVHEDFMFGSSCMNVYGITYDNKEVQIFKNGNYLKK